MTACSGPECDREAYARGLCQAHHRQLLRGRPLFPVTPRVPVTPVLVDGVPSHPDGLRAAKAAGAPGRCLFCEERLRGSEQIVCADRGCELARARAYDRDRRLDEREAL